MTATEDPDVFATVRAPRLPIEPLVDLVGWARTQVLTKRGRTRLLAEGGVTIGVADSVAHQLGLHPANVWGDDWWTVPLPDDDDPPAP